MGDKVEDVANDVEMNSSEIIFDNFTILKEFGNIVNLVRQVEELFTSLKLFIRLVTTNRSVILTDT